MEVAGGTSLAHARDSGDRELEGTVFLRVRRDEDGLRDDCIGRGSETD